MLTNLMVQQRDDTDEAMAIRLIDGETAEEKDVFILHQRLRQSMIVAIILRSFARNNSNFIHQCLTMYFYAAGLKRRAHDVLHGIGLVEAHTTLIRRLKSHSAKAREDVKQYLLNSQFVLVFDNFQYYEDVPQPRLGKSGKLVSAVTSKFYISHTIPQSGLRQDMLDHSVPLTKEDFRGSWDVDGTEEQIQTFQVFSAIRTAHPKAVDALFKDKAAPKMPPPTKVADTSKSESYNLEPIWADESTIEGTFETIKQIFVDQLGLDQEDKKAKATLRDLLTLIYGDQMTVDRLRSAMYQTMDSHDVYERKAWILPVIAPFHLRTNAIWLIKKNFGGEGLSQQTPCALSHNIGFWNHKRIPLGSDTEFYRSERAILSSFDARIVAIFYAYLQQSDRSRKWDDMDVVDQHIRGLGAEQFLEIVRLVKRDAFPTERRAPSVSDAKAAFRAWQKEQEQQKQQKKQPAKTRQQEAVPEAATSSGQPNGDTQTRSALKATEDEEWRCHRRFIRVVGAYKVLKHAVKECDTSMFRRSVNTWSLLFEGSKQYKYAFEMLYLRRLLNTTAATGVLQEALLTNMLVNSSGKKGQFHEIDLNLEHLNGKLKDYLGARRTSGYDLRFLFKTMTQTEDYTTSLRDIVETELGRPVDNRHATPSVVEDVQQLAYELSLGSIQRGRGARECPLKTVDLFSLGLARILAGGGKGTLDRLNAKVLRSKPPELAGASVVVNEASEDLRANEPGFGMQEEEPAEDFALTSEELEAMGACVA